MTTWRPLPVIEVADGWTVPLVRVDALVGVVTVPLIGRMPPEKTTTALPP